MLLVILAHFLEFPSFLQAGAVLCQAQDQVFLPAKVQLHSSIGLQIWSFLDKTFN